MTATCRHPSTGDDTRDDFRGDIRIACFENLPDPIFLTNPEGEWRLANDAARRLRGILPGTPETGALANLAAPGHDREIRDHLTDALRIGRARRATRLRTADGVHGLFELHSRRIDMEGCPAVLTVARARSDRSEIPAEDAPETEAARRDERPALHLRHRLADGRVRDAEVYRGHATPGGKRRMVSIVHDATEKRRLWERLEQSREMESLGRLSAKIAHDFNNILSSVIGYAEMALEDASDARLSANLRQVVAAGLRGRDLVHRLLSCYRRRNAAIRPVRVDRMIEESLTFLTPLLPSGIAVRRDIRSAASTPAAPADLHQILVNLLVNAVQAMGDAGGRLTVSLEDRERPTENGTPAPGLRLTVSDTGPGMDAETRERVFEPFFTTKASDGGSGIGLSAVRDIVKRLDGTISVDSRPGAGARFAVDLPVAGPEPDTPVPEVPSETREDPARILLVDDEEPVRRVMQLSLERMGHRVTAADSGEGALERFRNDPSAFDLVVADLRMPGLSGDRTAEEMLKIRPGLPILIVSGFGDNEAEARARAVGVRGCLIKPVCRKEFAGTIHRVLAENEMPNRHRRGRTVPNIPLENHRDSISFSRKPIWRKS